VGCLRADGKYAASAEASTVICMLYPHCKSRHGQQPVFRNTPLSEAEKNCGSFLCLSTEQSADCSVGTKIHMGSRDGRVDGDDVFDIAANPGNIVTTVTIDTLQVE
jgi:hypothetical protein